jgi:formate--tetrahydrofolate ligase
VERHIENLQQFGQSVVIGFNKFGFDTAEEIQYLQEWSQTKGAVFAINEGFAKGGEGATDLAQKVLDTIERKPSQPIIHTYDINDTIENKIEKIATKVYKAKSVSFGKNALSSLKKIKNLGGDKLPVCIAKTQFSFTDNATLVGAPKDFEITIDNLIINTGAGFVVAVAGEIMRMPGLPKEPAAMHIDVVNGEITGLS